MNKKSIHRRQRRIIGTDECYIQRDSINCAVELALREKRTLDGYSFADSNNVESVSIDDESISNNPNVSVIGNSKGQLLEDYNYT